MTLRSWFMYTSRCISCVELNGEQRCRLLVYRSLACSMLNAVEVEALETMGSKRRCKEGTRSASSSEPPRLCRLSGPSVSPEDSGVTLERDLQPARPVSSVVMAS